MAIDMNLIFTLLTNSLLPAREVVATQNEIKIHPRLTLACERGGNAKEVETT